jgi:uncharacterized protein (DUF433 family)
MTPILHLAQGTMAKIKIEDMATLDPREVPMYWLNDVALFTGVPASTVKRWTGQIGTAAPIIFAPSEELQQRDNELRLSFANLLEVHILDALRKENIPIARIKTGLEYLAGAIGTSAKHPLLSQPFYTVPGMRDMFVQTVEGTPLNVSRHGQPALGEILNAHLKRIKWDKNGPISLMPMRTDRVVISLHVAGGQPVVRDTGVLASMLAGRWNAGDSIDELAEDYKLPEADVREAVRYISATAA